MRLGCKTLGFQERVLELGVWGSVDPKLQLWTHMPWRLLGMHLRLRSDGGWKDVRRC